MLFCLHNLQFLFKREIQMPDLSGAAVLNIEEDKLRRLAAGAQQPTTSTKNTQAVTDTAKSIIEAAATSQSDASFLPSSLISTPPCWKKSLDITITLVAISCFLLFVLAIVRQDLFTTPRNNRFALIGSYIGGFFLAATLFRLSFSSFHVPNFK